ncbi:MAG: hypothetical protein ACI4KI_06545 [Candidatus Fimenecus sp.]
MKKGILVKILIGLIALAIIIGGIVFVIFLKPDKDENQPTEPKTTQSASTTEEQEPARTSEPTETEPQTQAAEPLTKQILSDILVCYSRTNLFGLYIKEYEYVDNPEQLPTSEYSECCLATGLSTVKEAKALTRQYLSDEITAKHWEMNKNAFLEKDGKLYVGTGARGIPSYSPSSLKIEQEGNRAKVFVDVFDSTTEYIQTESFEVAFENGRWIMVTEPVSAYFKTPYPSYPRDTIW